MRGYSWLVVNHPVVLVVVNIALAFVLGPLTILTIGLPDFSDPKLGFEPRGSKITTWEKVSGNVYGSLVNRTLSYYPTNYTGVVINTTDKELSSRKKRFVSNNTIIFKTCVNLALTKLDITDARFIVSSKSGENIFTASHLHSICRLQDAISAYPWPRKTCYMMSLSLYVTALANKTSCYKINDDDVSYVIKLLQRCSGYYFNGTLKPYCHTRHTCPSIPAECGNLNAVYPIMHVLTDAGFMEDGNASLTELAFSAILLPHGWFSDDEDLLLRYYLDNFEKQVVQDGDIVIPALHMNIENELFNRYVKEDITLYAIAMAMVVVVLLLYLRSVVLMIAVVINVIITLCLAFFFYHYIIQLHFFPFINLIAALLLIAISADDVFIIYDLWRQEIRNNPESSYEKIMSETLRKGGLSIFVTSFTTAASLLANTASKITTIRCFGIFASICILLNFILMITWIPALIVIIEKTVHLCVSKDILKKSGDCFDKVTKMSDYFWGVIMMKIITIGSPIWVICLVILGILGLVAVFAKPGLKLPENSELKVFNPDNPFEKYREFYKKRIRFEKESEEMDTIEMVFLWGVKGVDNGDIWDPTNTGTLEFTPVDVYSPNVVSWQNKFCHRLKEQSFVHEIHRNDDCFFEVVNKLLAGPCDIKPKNQAWKKEVNLAPCCGLESPNRTMTELCMVHYADISGGYLDRLAGNKVLGEIIMDTSNKIKINSYTFKSTAVLTPSYVYMNDFYKNIEKFATEELSDAPDVVKDGWFSSHIGSFLLYYDVQKEIAAGTMKGIGLSLTCSFVVLLATSLNIVLSLYAIVTITMIIGATVGSLVFLGWELNVTESLTITMSLGLAVDFTIHYGVTYKLANSKSRADRVKHTVTSVSSAVSMAALTTFVSGVSVLGARVLAYRQFGTFLVFVMFYSWVFSTFLFLPLCYAIGPLGNTGDIVYLFHWCRKKCKRGQQSTTDRPPTMNGTVERPKMNGAISTRVEYENLTSLSPVYFRRPDVSRPSALYDPSSLDSKLMSSSDTLFDVRAARGREAGLPFVNGVLANRHVRRNEYDNVSYDDKNVHYWRIKRPTLLDRQNKQNISS